MFLTLIAAQSIWPLTKAEATNYEATSTYQDVIDNLKSLERLGAPIHLTWIGKSTEGRDIPLAIVADPMVRSEAEARHHGKLVVYIEANIHAGEVEGKEAALILLRKLAEAHAAHRQTILKDLVLVVNPIYNSDGNEKFDKVEKNRPEQDGPKLVGVRANGQGLDLNRDCIKAESPEMKAALTSVYQAWDPDAVLDLHTTDGTRHGYDVTYSPMLAPDSLPGIYKYALNELMPTIRRQFRAKYSQEIFPYGDAYGQEEKQEWRTFGSEGRYVTNYAGLCNRIGVLSEAATYIPFKDRIVATSRLVDLVLAQLIRDKEKVRRFRSQQTLPSELGVRFEQDSIGSETILLEKLENGEAKPLSGRPKAIQQVQAKVFDRFRATRMAKVPYAYLVPSSLSPTIQLLRRHGVVLDRFEQAWSTSGESFRIASLHQADQPFQGHRLITLEGSFHSVTVQAEKGDYLVKTDQPLGALAFHILEPEGTDGAVAWGFMGNGLSGDYPVVKIITPPKTRRHS